MQQLQCAQFLHEQLLQQAATLCPHARNRLCCTIHNIRMERMYKCVMELFERQLTRLSCLTVNECGLRTFEDFPALPQLMFLDVSHNMLRGSFQFLVRYSKLRYLDVSHNLVKSFDKFQALRVFRNLQLYAKNNPFYSVLSVTELNKIANKFKKINIKYLQKPKKFKKATKNEQQSEQKNILDQMEDVLKKFDAEFNRIVKKLGFDAFPEDLLLRLRAGFWNHYRKGKDIVKIQQQEEDNQNQKSQNQKQIQKQKKQVKQDEPKEQQSQSESQSDSLDQLLSNLAHDAPNIAQSFIKPPNRVQNPEFSSGNDEESSPQNQEPHNNQ